MRKVLTILILLIMLFPINLFSRCYTKTDYYTGNKYTVCDEGTKVKTKGYNYNTGSTWSQTYDTRTNTYKGRDKKGNYYQGDNNTGYYHNYGTGKTCTGKGVFRTCY